MEQPLLLVVGPTGSGKTAAGIELCERLNGEIVSADSMQIYRGCDIATAKATPEDQARARHHLLDIREPHEKYSAAQWAHDATFTIADIRARGKQPIIVGGTGFYLRALLQPDSLPDVPPNPELRAQLERDAAEQGDGALHELLTELVSHAAARLHPNDRRRVIRALEIALACATPRNEPSAEPEYFASGLEMPRERLYYRLDERVDNMLAAGFMEELRTLVAFYPADCLALQSLGYKQMRPVLDDPTRCDECVALWKRDTRRYAKRQMTWFRHQLPVHWVWVKEDSSSQSLADEMVREWETKLRDIRLT